MQGPLVDKRRLRLLCSAFLCLAVLLLLACDKDIDGSCQQCTLGRQKCAADLKGILLCKQILTTGCYQFTLQRCNPGLVCTESLTPGGALSCQVEGQNCLTKCPLGTKQCEGETITVCRTDAASGCPQWLPERTCGPGNPCQNGACQGEPQGCTPTNPQQEKRCVGNDVYWFDDCGQQGAVVEQCLESCLAGQCQSTGPCTPNVPQHVKKCDGNDVYWYDDCDQKGTLVEACPEICKDGKCETNSGCTPKDTMYQKKCVGNDSYWFDDCGGKRELVEACPPSKQCQNGVCAEPGCAGGTNECALGDTRCSGADIIQSCDKDPTTSCFVWGPTNPCGVGTKCQNGQCLRDPNGGGSCQTTGSLGQCKSDFECCSQQTCKKVLFFLNLCGPCSADADCPVGSGGAQQKCCPNNGDSYCADVCDLP